MPRQLAQCPVCSGSLTVTEVECSHCRTRVHGAFDSCRFCRLAPEHLAFLEIFLRSEGNLSRVEKELKVSYPTVRNRLVAALTAAGLADRPDEGGEATGEESAAASEDAKRRAVLEALARGELTAEQAAAAFRTLP